MERVFYGEFIYQKHLYYERSTLTKSVSFTLTLENANSIAEIGSIFCGNKVEFGASLYAGSIGASDFSKIETDCFDERADEFLESLPKFADELNAVIKATNEFYNGFFPTAEEKGEAIVQECKSEATKVAGEIQKIKEDAKKKIESTITASSGRLKESANSTYLLVLSVREIVIKNRRNYKRVGEVKEFRGQGVPSGYVKLPCFLAEIF